MHKHVKPHFCQLFCVVVLTTATGCSWVDSTGAQGTEDSSSNSAGNGLRNAQALAIMEETSLTAALEGEGASLENWNWSLENTDVNNRCAAFDGFDAQLSAGNLSNACTSSAECTVAINETRGDGATRFTLQMPRLRAPVALSYRLTTTREDGAQVSRQQLLCGLSINEAPLAIDDHYLVVTDELRIVDAQDADSLLSNDQDDDDIRNQLLRVLTTPVSSPEYAAQFALDTEGGFIYAPLNSLPVTDSGYVEDSFVYAVTDGVHTVNATATIRIVDTNRGPKRVRRIPDVTINAATSAEELTPVQIELSRYFSDPDNDSLSYSVTPGPLAGNEQVATVHNGVLNLLASNADVGQWLIEINATDGLQSTRDSFVLTVLSSGTMIDGRQNQIPTVTDIKNRIVQNTFKYDVSGFFTDVDGDALSFSAAGLPDDVSISRTGIIRGKSDDDNRGSWFIQVTADDNRGGTVTDGFRLVIN